MRKTRGRRKRVEKLIGDRVDRGKAEVDELTS
jgi:hypothetical protein